MIDSSQFSVVYKKTQFEFLYHYWAFVKTSQYKCLGTLPLPVSQACDWQGSGVACDDDRQRRGCDEAAGRQSRGGRRECRMAVGSTVAGSMPLGPRGAGRGDRRTGADTCVQHDSHPANSGCDEAAARRASQVSDGGRQHGCGAHAARSTWCGQGGQKHRGRHARGCTSLRARAERACTATPPSERRPPVPMAADGTIHGIHGTQRARALACRYCAR